MNTLTRMEFMAEGFALCSETKAEIKLFIYTRVFSAINTPFTSDRKKGAMNLRHMRLSEIIALCYFEILIVFMQILCGYKYFRLQTLSACINMIKKCGYFLS